MSLVPFPHRDSIDQHYQCDDILDFLGQGTFASVYKAVCCAELEGVQVQFGQEVALKVIQKRDLTQDKQHRDVINEVEILRLVKHPNCVRLLDYFQTPHHVVIVMNYVAGTELFQALIKTSFSETHVRQIMYQLMSALCYLHTTLGVVHRDVKPENILVTPSHDTYLVTLVDFGLARRVEGKLTRLIPRVSLGAMPRPRGSVESLDSPMIATPCGTLKYAAPETVKSCSQSIQMNTTKALLPRIDIYAAGLIMYAMLCGVLPFRDVHNRATLYREMEKGPDFGGTRWEAVTPDAIELNRRLLLFDPAQRPRSEEVIQSPWFQHSPHPHESSMGSQSCLLEDSILSSSRDYVMKMFDAIQAPEGDLLFQEPPVAESLPVPPQGRCISVSFGKPNPPSAPPTNYFGY